MDWTGGRHDRVLAGVYLAGWALTVLGVIWTLINQATAGTGWRWGSSWRGLGVR